MRDVDCYVCAEWAMRDMELSILFLNSQIKGIWLFTRKSLVGTNHHFGAFVLITERSHNLNEDKNLMPDKNVF